MTTATPDGKELFAVAVAKDTGKIVFDLKLFDVPKPQFAHAFNSYASPTPAIEPGRVYVTFGSPGTAALDTATGKVLWTRRDLECNHFRGAGSSPVIFRDLLLMHFDGSDVQYVVALDKKTGKTVWKTPRSIDFQDIEPDGKPKADGDFRKAFGTPQVVDWQGKPVFISLGSQAAYGYDPLTGRSCGASRSARNTPPVRVLSRETDSCSTRPVSIPGRSTLYVPTAPSPGREPVARHKNLD